MKVWYGALAILLSVLGARFSVSVNAPALSAETQAQIDAGRQVFAATCANCHGAAGNGALGPPLAHRNLPLDLIRSAILNGRIGSAMPQFKGELDPASLAAVMAYVRWLETDGSQPQTPILMRQDNEDSGAPSSQPTSIGQNTGVPARGAALFFDPTHVCSCRTCHSFRDRGGPVGPDLATMKEGPEGVYRQLVRASPAAGFRAILIDLRDGKSLRGISSEEGEAAVSFFDVSSCPPVKRTFARVEILKLSEISGSAIYDHRALKLSKQDLLDLSAYLGARTSPP